MADLPDRSGSSGPAASAPAASADVSTALGGSDPALPARAPALDRFETCRWRVVPASGPPYCSHGEVLPYTGTHGFRAEAWCPECGFYKVRRGVRKRLAPGA
jgi:hypothetical protein